MNLSRFAKLYIIDNDLDNLTPIQRVFVSTLASMKKIKLDSSKDKLNSNYDNRNDKYYYDIYYYVYNYKGNFLWISINAWIRYYIGLNNDISQVENEILIFVKNNNLKIDRIILEF